MTAAPLADGMPTLGLGTWQNTDPKQCRESVRTALEMGYRHVDTAQHYRNEEAVGEGVARADVDREDVFLATKVWFDRLAPADVVASTEESLDRLGVSYLDLLYVHWPAGAYDPEGTLAAFADLHDDGVVDRVGVSNFTPALLDEAVAECDAPVFANQFECHPLLPQDDLRAACADRGVEPVAYSPLARGRVFGVPEIRDVADAHDASPAQVSLAWLRGHGLAAIPKATGEAHLRDDLASLDLELGDDEMARIDGIEERVRTIDPGLAPW